MAHQVYSYPKKFSLNISSDVIFEDDPLAKLERQLFSLFQMDIMDIIDNKWAFWEVKNTPPQYIDQLKWWEWEEYIKRLQDKIKRENEQKETDAKQMGQTPHIPDYAKKLPNVDSMMRNINKFK